MSLLNVHTAVGEEQGNDVLRQTNKWLATVLRQTNKWLATAPKTSSRCRGVLVTLRFRDYRFCSLTPSIAEETIKLMCDERLPHSAKGLFIEALLQSVAQSVLVAPEMAGGTEE
jgi:hypothetical protein